MCIFNTGRIKEEVNADKKSRKASFPAQRVDKPLPRLQGFSITLKG
ncbi:hypothetical protein CHCC12620_0645 [Bacillus paralicheniformis]|nr:hypothetical protein CHCC12620_0645 [Bacillus paralicheniformis]